MEDGKMLFDASAYMLFEATGDSDAQCFDGAFEIDSAAAEDDAQSCSFGSACGGAWLNDAVDAGGDDFDAWSEDEDDDGGGATSDDDDDGVVDQCRARRAAAPVKSNGCEDSNAKMMNERERDRQFWEACLAS